MYVQVGVGVGVRAMNQRERAKENRRAPEAERGKRKKKLCDVCTRVSRDHTPLHHGVFVVVEPRLCDVPLKRLDKREIRNIDAWRETDPGLWLIILG